MRCNICGYEGIGAEIEGKLVCHNCFAIWASNGGGFSVCRICKKPASGVVHDFNMETKKDFKIPLCIDHLKAIALHRLTPKEFKAIKEAYGITFYIHEDFYDSKGRAIA